MVSIPQPSSCQPRVHSSFLTPSLAGAGNISEGEEQQRGRGKLLQPLSLPKNRSTGNLSTSADTPDRSRVRMSFDASSPAAVDHDSLTRFVPLSFDATKIKSNPTE